MSFSYNSGLWQPRTTSEHSADILANINGVLAANNVQVNGVLVQFTASIANVVWIICLAVGAMRALYDNILFAASQMFSVSEAADSQILAVLPLSGTTLIPGAYSLVTIQVTAAAAGNAVIPTNALLPLTTIGNFKVVAGATVLAGTTVSFLCQFDTLGPVAAAAHAVTAFKTPIANVQTVDNALPAIVGRNLETVGEVRHRLIKGNIADIGIDGTIRAVKAIQGITTAAMYFNFDPVNNLLIPGGIVLPPRYAYLIVQGSDITGSAIATAYARRMIAPTLGSSSQTFVTQSGQNFPVNFDYAAGYAVYVIVYYDPTSITASGFQTSIQQLIVNMAVQIGQRITSALISQTLVGFPYALVTGAQVSSDSVIYQNEVLVPANKVAVFSAANILVLPQP
jgi:hypothetical protein